MQSKTELFRQWRGNRFETEQYILSSALLISDYVNSVPNLKVIKDNAEKKYKDFDEYSARGWGTAAFVKLLMDEAMSQLPETAQQERVLLTQSSELISALFNNWKNKTSANLSALIGNIEKFISLNSIPFTDKNYYKTFLLSSYMFFYICKIGIADLEKDLKKRIVAAVLFDLQQIKSKIDYFLLKIEERMDQLESENLAKKEGNIVPDLLKPAKDLLIKRYFKVLGLNPLSGSKSQRTTDSQYLKELAPGKGFIFHQAQKPIKRNILQSLALLEDDLKKVDSGIYSLINQRNIKVELESKIEAINILLSSAEENDTRIIGRKYFIEFVEEHEHLFKTLLDQVEESKKLQLLEKIKQLKSDLESSDLSSGVVNGVSWVTSPITLVYRTATPQALQEMITSSFFTTLDSECKTELKKLAAACLSVLRSELEKKEKQIIAINNRFFNQDEELKMYMAKESSQKLVILQEANKVMREAVETGCRLLTTVKENSLIFHNLQAHSQTLSEFIKLHDNFFVRISNFLAQFFSFFKTNTAKMIDDAADWKNKVDNLAREYQCAVEEGIQQIEHIPHLDETIISYIKTQSKVEEQQLRLEKQDNINPNKRNVRLLMNNLADLYGTKSSTCKEQKYDEVQEVEKVSVVCP